MLKRKEIWSNGKPEGARVSIFGVGEGKAKGRTGVSHRRSLVPVIFPSKAAWRAYSRRPGLEKKRNRESLKQHDEARREEAEEHEEALLHREADSLHGKTKAKLSRSLSLSSVSHFVPLSLFGSVLVQVAPSSLFNSVRLAPVSALQFGQSFFSSLSLSFSFFPFSLILAYPL